MKQILITGGAGFIGSHLCARLLEEGNEVICLDNYFTGSKENVIPLLKNPHFELIRHDVSNTCSKPRSMRFIIWHVPHLQFIIK